MAGYLVVGHKQNEIRIKTNKKTRGFKAFRIFAQKDGMNTKLTLTIEQKIIERAKKYAKAKNRSLSDIIENYLKSLTYNEPDAEPELDPAIESLKGAFKMPKNVDYKQELRNRLEKKYL